MTFQQPIAASIFDINSRARAVGLLSGTLLLVILVIAPIAQAQTFQVLHTFTGGPDGANPSAGGLASDRAGNLYGTAGFGGLYTSACNWGGAQTGCGTVFKLSHRNGAWSFNVLHSFNGQSDGYSPDQIVSFGPDGTLYGSTYWGPSGGCNEVNNCGTIFRLQPPARVCNAVPCPWAETVLHSFQGYPNDGAQPACGSIIFDSAGNLYSTTSWGGPHNIAGNVYELSRSGNQWTEFVLYNFTSGYDGDAPWSGVIMDASGKLYGTTNFGGLHGFGVIFQLTPTQSGWTETVLHSFQLATDGETTTGSLVMDSAGNLYGASSDGGPNGGGTVWELSPSGSGWTFNVLYAFTGTTSGGPSGGLLMDAAGSLYGATLRQGTHNWGNVFKLSPGANGWNYSSLYDFTGGNDGAEPGSKMVMDADGSLYGITYIGGSGQGFDGYGVVFELTP